MRFVPLLLLVAGCNYPGAGGYPAYDFSAAASKYWMVTISNSNVFAWPTIGNGDVNFVLPSHQQYHADASDLLGCGVGIADGPTVVYSFRWGRFVYAALTGNSVCLSSSLDTAYTPTADVSPIAIDRQYLLTADLFNETRAGRFFDQPHVSVSDTNLVIAVRDYNLNNLQETPVTLAMVIPLMDLVNGVALSALHRQTVSLSDVYSPAIPVGNANNIYLTKRAGAAGISIVKLSGTPGVNGGVQKQQTFLALSSGRAATDETVAALAGNVLYTATDAGQPTDEIELDQITGIDTNFTPQIVGAARFGAAEPFAQSTLSVSATPGGHVLVGYGLNGYSYLAMWSPGGHGLLGPAVVDPAIDPQSQPNRIDFVPVGAGFYDDVVHRGQWYACAGFHDQSTAYSFTQGQHLVCLRDEQF